MVSATGHPDSPTAPASARDDAERTMRPYLDRIRDSQDVLAAWQPADGIHELRADQAALTSTVDAALLAALRLLGIPLTAPAEPIETENAA